MEGSITEILNRLNSGLETDTAYIIAAHINLYNESMRRRSGRVLYTPADVMALFDMFSIGLNAGLLQTKQPLSEVRSHELTEFESKHVETAGVSTQ